MSFNRMRRLSWIAGTTLLAIGLIIGLDAPSDAQSSISNAYISVTTATAPNQFTAVTTGGDPVTTADDGLVLLHSVLISLRIDGGAQAGGSDIILGAPSSVKVISSNEMQVQWLQPITVTTTSGNLVVNLDVKLLHDTIRWGFSIVNDDTLSHSVGIRLVEGYNGAGLPVTVGTTVGYGGAPVRTNNHSTIHNEVDYVGPQVPTFWSTNVPVSQNGANGRFVIRGLTATSSASESVWASDNTRPDEFTLAPVSLFAADPWGVTIDPTQLIDSTGTTAPLDPAVALYYNPVELVPGDTRTVVNYFGLGVASENFDQPMVEAVEGPAYLNYNGQVTGFLTLPNQPSTPIEITAPGVTPAIDNPITIEVSVQNLTTITLDSYTATLNLPQSSGLELAPGQAATQGANSSILIAPGGEKSFFWQLLPNTSSPQSGIITYYVTVSTGIAGGKSVTRTMEIPAIPNNQKFPSGLQLISLPFVFSNPQPSVAFNLDPANFMLLDWDGTAGSYEAVSQIQPGLGYWLQLSQGQQISLTGASPVPNQTGASSQFTITLPQGWTLIGNPYLYNIRWGDMQVLNPATLQILPLNVASDGNHNWISPTIYYWVQSEQDYAFSQDLGYLLQPYAGFWIFSFLPNLKLIFPPIDQPGATVTRVVSNQQPVGVNNWRLQISATSANTNDMHNYIGVSSQVTGNYNPLDALKPPAYGRSVSLALVHTDWGDHNGVYAQDLRSPSDPNKKWTIRVTSPEPNQNVTITWPNMAQVPKQYELTLTDPTDGSSRSMRTTSSIVVNTGSSGTRDLTITANLVRLGQALLISQLDAQRTGGRATGAPQSVNITYTVSRAVSYSRITIRSASGQVIRVLSTGRAVQAGVNSVVWDLRDSKGISVPSGSYLISVVVADSQNQQARMVTPYLVIR